MFKIFLIFVLTILADRNCNPKSVTPDYASAEQLQSGIATGVIMFTESQEQWKPIKGYEGLYEISNLGRVKSLKRKINNRYNEERILKSNINSGGYLLCHLTKEKKTFAHTIHSVVWDHFGVGKRDNRKIQVDHVDNNKQNCRIDNLQLLTSRENVIKTYLHKDKSSKYTGVCLSSKKYKGKIYSYWIAQISSNGIHKYLGCFKTNEEAALAYNNRVMELSGEFAYLNKLD
jgi:hypothetical protein